jgi:hypothetical protein
MERAAWKLAIHVPVVVVVVVVVVDVQLSFFIGQ